MLLETPSVARTISKTVWVLLQFFMLSVDFAKMWQQRKTGSQTLVGPTETISQSCETTVGYKNCIYRITGQVWLKTKQYIPYFNNRLFESLASVFNVSFQSMSTYITTVRLAKELIQLCSQLCDSFCCSKCFELFIFPKWSQHRDANRLTKWKQSCRW